METHVYKALIALLTVGLIIAGVGYYNTGNASDRWLMDIQGGQAPCCKDCYTWNVTIYECDHDIMPAPVKCKATSCLENIINTDNCKMGGAAVKCKTKDAVPKAAACIQNAYLNLVNCPFGADTAWTNLDRLIGGATCVDFFGAPVKVSCRGTLGKAQCIAGLPDPTYTGEERLGNKQVCIP